MRVLVIFAHPLEDGYGAALRDVVIQSLIIRSIYVTSTERHSILYFPRANGRCTGTILVSHWAVNTNATMKLIPALSARRVRKTR